MMKTYDVLVPIAGHLLVTVRAESEKQAIEEAFLAPVTLEFIESWDMVKSFIEGNICHCPHPWTAEVVTSYEEKDSDYL